MMCAACKCTGCDLHQALMLAKTASLGCCSRYEEWMLVSRLSRPKMCTCSSGCIRQHNHATLHTASSSASSVWSLTCRFELYGRPSADRIYIFNGEQLYHRSGTGWLVAESLNNLLGTPTWICTARFVHTMHASGMKQQWLTAQLAQPVMHPMFVLSLWQYQL
jgi:hypothetical protein